MNVKLLSTLLVIGLVTGCQATTEPPAVIDYSKVKLAYGNVVNDGEVFIPAWIRNEKQINEVLSNEHYCSDNLILRHQSMTEKISKTLVNCY